MTETGGQMNICTNKLAVIHVLAGIIQNPVLLDADNYVLELDDFPEQFHKSVFKAVYNLHAGGMNKIDYIDIDQYLKQYAVEYQIFTNNRGIEYIQNALKMYNSEKFEYYFQTLKKYSLLNRLNSMGIDTSDIYNPNIIDPVAAAKMFEKFEQLTINDIILSQETKIINIKNDFTNSSDRVENHAGDGLRELKERLKLVPEMGLGLQSPKLTTIFRGQRRGCLFIESAPSGCGKSRRGNSEACRLAVPEYYDVCERKWVQTGSGKQSVLIISTELEEYECQQMWMAFVAGVSEAHIKDGRYGIGEEDRVDKAIRLLEESNLYFVSITNYDTDDIINIIKKYKHLHDVNYVYFDYLGETLKITSSATRKMKVQGIRTDQILLMLTSALKDIAKTLGIYIWTASQLSGDYKNARDLDAAYLRSAKSIADKVDAGSILMPVRDMDQPVIESYMEKGFELAPNFVITIYKVRAGSYQNVKLYGYFDRSTCQWTDCFVTNSSGEIINVDDTNVDAVLDSTQEDNLDNVFIESSSDNDIDNNEFFDY